MCKRRDSPSPLREQGLKHQAAKVKVIGLDYTRVKCQGHDRIVAVVAAVLMGQPLTFDLLKSEAAFHTKRWVRDLDRMLGAEEFVTDDADRLKNAGEELGLEHQVCRAHANCHAHALIDALDTQALEHLHPVPWELKSPGVTWINFSKTRVRWNTFALFINTAFPEMMDKTVGDVLLFAANYLMALFFSRHGGLANIANMSRWVHTGSDTSNATMLTQRAWSGVLLG